VYCLLVNRFQFIREQSYAAHHQTVSLTRALLCEIVAEKILRRTNEQNPGWRGLLLLAEMLVTAFDPFQHAPEELVRQNAQTVHWPIQKNSGRIEGELSSLEVALVSESKSLLATTACRKVIDAIYQGKIVYTPNTFIDIIPDNWKHRPISLYDPRRAPLLNQYRLVVPRTRNIIEICQFTILLVLYILVLSQREGRLNTIYTTYELVFDIYAAGWILDQTASVLEHGWQVYSQNLWAFLDVGFSLIYMVYLVMRLQAMTIVSEQKAIFLARTALDILSVAAPVLIPRLAFNLMSENMLFVCLRAMMADFLTLTLIAFWCFAGFLLSMKWLHEGIHESITISKWLIWIWFGLDGTGIQKSTDFHWLFGPILFVAFAFLGNTLFITILVSMLSTTFSQISSNATAEIEYRHAVLTFEGVKSDAIFAYMPPLNILALLTMLPLKFVLSPRYFHKINVFVVRTINAPLLLLISLIERNTLWIEGRASPPNEDQFDSPLRPTPAHEKSFISQTLVWFSKLAVRCDVRRFSAHGDIQAVFDTPPPQSVLDEEASESNTRISQHEQGPVSMLPRSESTHKVRKAWLGSQDYPTCEAGRQSRRFSPIHDDNHGDEQQGQVATITVHGTPTAGSQAPQPFNKAARKDSIIDYSGETDGAMAEANERLQKLEDSVQRIEQMLTRLLDATEVDEAVEADGEREV
jgi:hypothetical protein